MLSSIPTSIKILLGFDFGLKHIGVAVGQTETRSAQALTSIKANKGTPNWDDIKKLMQLWHPQAIVVGIPLNMDGTEQPITQQAKHFVEQLKQHYALPVYQADERLTSVEARSHLFASGGYQALNKKAIDSTAAKLILEAWLLENFA